MKLVREYINEKFTEESDPIKDLGIGQRHLIEIWLKENDLTNCIINKDLTINSNSEIILTNKSLINGKLPNYIQFNIVYEAVEAYGTKLNSLRGFPYEIRKKGHYYGNLYVINNELATLEHIPKIIDGNVAVYDNKVHFSNKYIKSLSKIGRDILRN